MVSSVCFQNGFIHACAAMTGIDAFGARIYKIAENRKVMFEKIAEIYKATLKSER